MRFLCLLALLVVGLFAVTATAGHICKSPDCSDIVGDHLVKDSSGKATHFHDDHQHHEWREEQRKHRTHIKRRERPDQDHDNHQYHHDGPSLVH